MDLHSENNYLKKKKDKYLAVDKWLISKQLKQMNQQSNHNKIQCKEILKNNI